MIKSLDYKDKGEWKELYDKIANNAGFELYELKGD